MDAIPPRGRDPFSPDFFDDPYPGHALVVHLARYDCLAIGRYAEIRAMLSDREHFGSVRDRASREWLPRWPNCRCGRPARTEIATPPVRRPNNTLRGLRQLRLRLHRA